MTEEIIIDGVNVAGWTDEEVYYKFEHHTSKAIKQITFDLYRQLKRLEQERDELLEEVKQLHNGRSTEELYTLFGKPIKYWEELEQENKELKEENIKVKKEFNNLIAEIISDVEYTCEITCNGESPKEHIKKCQKALKALEEIRELVRADCKGCTAECDCDEDCTRYIIKNKINEVLE